LNKGGKTIFPLPNVQIIEHKIWKNCSLKKVMHK
jgi:hypothetical protein